MSLSARELVSTTTGIVRKSSSALISASTSRPFLRGNSRSSKMRSGRGAPPYAPSRRKNSSACIPSSTTCSSLRTSICPMISRTIIASVGLSSTRRTRARLPGAAPRRSVLLTAITLGLFNIVHAPDRQSEVEGRPLARYRIHPYASVMALHDLAADGETNAVTRVLAAVMQPLEHAENAVDVLGLDADAVVTYRENISALMGLRTHVNLGGALAAKLYGVADQVLEQLRELRRVDGAERHGIARHHRARLLDGDLEIRQRLLQRLAEIAGLERTRARAHPRVAQKVVDERLHAQRPAHGVLDQLIGSAVQHVAVTLLQQLHAARDGAQRLLQIVRCDVGELSELAVAALQLIGIAAQLRLGALALGDVNNGSQAERALFGPERAETDFHRHLASVLVPSAQIAAGAHGTCARFREKVGAITGMRVAQALGQQTLDRLPEQFRAPVAEERLELAVHEHDASLLVDHDHRGRRPSHHDAELLLRTLAIVDVDHRSDPFVHHAVQLPQGNGAPDAVAVALLAVMPDARVELEHRYLDQRAPPRFLRAVAIFRMNHREPSRARVLLPGLAGVVLPGRQPLHDVAVAVGVEHDGARRRDEGTIALFAPPQRVFR